MKEGYENRWLVAFRDLGMSDIESTILVDAFLASMLCLFRREQTGEIERDQLIRLQVGMMTGCLQGLVASDHRPEV